ncbi:MAG: RNA methyltransferase [Lachnospiraceae bacterium]|nr:RNA methyltransferase [Lachnospiraceae bacterium]
MNYYPVDDINIPELALFNERAETKLYRFYEPDPGLFVVETPMVIERALAAGYEPVAMVGEEAIARREAERLAPQLGDIPVYLSTDRVLSEIAGYRLARGLLCEFRRRKLPDPETVCAGASRVVLLEEVQNPTNVGAIFRSAAALGMEAVLLSKGCADPLYRRASRVSVGNVFLVPWTIFDSRMTAAQRISWLKAQGYVTVAMALSDNAVRLGEQDFGGEEKIAVIMGNEGEGLSAETIEACDVVVKIPMGNGVDSLNVAAASAIAFWELRKK